MKSFAALAWFTGPEFTAGYPYTAVWAVWENRTRFPGRGGGPWR